VLKSHNFSLIKTIIDAMFPVLLRLYHSTELITIMFSQLFVKPPWQMGNISPYQVFNFISPGIQIIMFRLIYVRLRNRLDTDRLFYRKCNELRPL